MAKPKAKAGFAGAQCSAARARDNAIWLQHTAGKRGGKFVLTSVGDEVETLLETGSGVLVLRALRKMELQIPDIMNGPKCWETDWTVHW